MGGANKGEFLALEEEIMRLKQMNESIVNRNADLEALLANTESQPKADPMAEQREKEMKKAIETLTQKVKDLERLLQEEKERNMQLRVKSGQAFMEALNDPLLMQTGGKKKAGLYNPEDDKALMRLLDNIDA